MKPFNSKRGISLIAVLMFMLAATTASIVVFRYISQENLASGSRLKQTEAYQAAESGLDAAQAWLSNKGPDVGGLVGSYFSQAGKKQPINLTEVVGSMHSNRDQKFEVYLAGIDSGATGNSALKFEILSVGIGRDNSEVKLTGIFEVDGLYKVKVPISAHTPEKGNTTKIPPYYGSSIKFEGTHEFSSAIVNGDWTGNPPKILEDFIVTGNVGNSGDKVDVGGNLCVGKNFQPNNNSRVGGDAYFKYSDSIVGGFMGTYEGNVQCDSVMRLGASNGMIIRGNLTLGGRMYNIKSSNPYRIENDLILDKNAYIDGREIEDGTRFIVCGSVWSANEAGVIAAKEKASNQDGVARIHFNAGAESNPGTYKCDSKPDAYLAFKNAIYLPSGSTDLDAGNGKKYRLSHRTFNIPSGYFYTPLGNRNSAEERPANADAAKKFCDGVWRDEPGCPNKVVDNPILSSLEEIKQFNASVADNSKSYLDRAVKYDSVKFEGPGNRIEANNGFKCLIDVPMIIGTQGDVSRNDTTIVREKNGIERKEINEKKKKITDILNDCYNVLKSHSNKLYKGYMVIKLKQNEDYTPDNKLLNGKFIFIYPEQQDNVNLPPTTKDSKVMIFFEKDVNTLRAKHCPKDAEYNYFIYSLRSIETIDDWPKDCPLNGNLYFPLNGCTSGSLKRANNNFNIKENEELVMALQEANIIYANPDAHGNTLKPGTETPSYEHEKNRWLAVSSRLKVSLISKNISRKTKLPAAVSLVEKSILVMPRVVRLTTGAYKSQLVTGSNKLSNFYTFMPLNGAKTEDQPQNSPFCKGVPGSKNTSQLPIGGLDELPEGYYECTFNKDKVSNFYVVVKGKGGSATVRLSEERPMPISLDSEDKCRNVRVITEENIANFEVTVTATKTITDDDWTIEPIKKDPCKTSGNYPTWTISCLNNVPEGDIAIFKVCATKQTTLNSKVKLELSGQNVVDPRNSLIEIQSQKIMIRRIDDPNRDYASCPHKGSDWINLTCSSGPAIPEGTDLWSCSLTDPLSASYTLTLPTGCEMPPNINQNPANINIPINNNTEVSFVADLAWKKYTVTVNGGSRVINLEADGSVLPPPNERNFNCSGSCTTPVYHGATYRISAAANAKYQVSNCSSDLVCSQTSFDLINGKPGGTITPIGNGTIEVKDAAVRGSCELLRTSVTPGFIFDSTLVKVTPTNCGTIQPNVTYKIEQENVSPREFTPTDTVNVPAGNYKVSAYVTCNSAGIQVATLECHPDLAVGTQPVVNQSSGSSAGQSSNSGGGSGCAAGSTLYTTQGANANTTGAICLKKLGAISGWNASNAQGRTCSVNGGTAITPVNGGISAQPSATPTSDGHVYINCTAGTKLEFSLSCW